MESENQNPREQGRNEGNIAAQEQENPQNQQQVDYFNIFKGFVIRAFIIYLVTSYFSRRPQNTQTPVTDGNGKLLSKLPATNIFPDGLHFDLYVYLCENEKFSFKNNPNPIWFKEDLQYGDWTSGKNSDGIYEFSTSLSASENLQNNGSIYLHTYVVKSGFSPDPSKSHVSDLTIYTSQRLNKYKKRRYLKTSNLITGKTDRSEDEIRKSEVMSEEIISHWHPNITINLVHDFTQWIPGGVPAPFDEFIQFSPQRDTYKPILFLNTYWNLNRDHFQMNSTVKYLNLTITFQPLSLFKWQMYATQSMKNKWPGASVLGADNEDDDDQDTVKEMFLETSPYLLALTAIVSILHSVFEMLAFKNDIQFWNNRKSLEGLSVRSVFFNVFQSLIVLLYILDHDTNFVIKVSCFVGLGIEVWKIFKVTDVSVNREKKILGIPTLSFEDKGTYVESQTKKYDEMAFKYLGVAFFPLMGGYFVYSLVYHEHKGWYSFVLSMFYGFLLTFGFIMMTPQLFINYKLKSVAHLPWRMLTYKALNTFIDDIFAFVIKMPTMYRIGCLRDDVIFFIFLYQRYIYKIDPKRVNEFGFSQEMSEGKVNEASDSEQKSVEDKKNE